MLTINYLTLFGTKKGQLISPFLTVILNYIAMGLIKLILNVLILFYLSNLKLNFPVFAGIELINYKSYREAVYRSFIVMLVKYTNL